MYVVGDFFSQYVAITTAHIQATGTTLFHIGIHILGDVAFSTNPLIGLLSLVNGRRKTMASTDKILFCGCDRGGNAANAFLL